MTSSWKNWPDSLWDASWTWFRGFLDTLGANCYDPMLKLRSHCTSLAELHSCGLWTMAISLLISEIHSRQDLSLFKYGSRVKLFSAHLRPKGHLPDKIGAQHKRPSQFRSMTNCLSCGFWIMKTDRVVSEIYPLGPFLAFYAPLVLARV